jgi:hypothetical protein
VKRISALFVCALLLGTAAPSAAQTDIDQVLSLTLRKVLVRDSAICATTTCKGVAVAIMAPDSVTLHHPFPVPVVRITPAQTDSVRRTLRTFVVRSVSITESSAQVEIEYLWRGRALNVFAAPDPPPGALPAAEGGWHFTLRRTENGWVIDRMVEWIT